MTLVKELKQNSQDHEFYPTSYEIIGALRADLLRGEEGGRSGGFLDVGAGNGKVLKAVADEVGDLYAIEKSSILIQQLPENVFVIGTEFGEQNFIDKRVDTVFCNPPYSAFEAWAGKLVREANCHRLYLVIPERWEQSQQIKSALEARDVEATIIGEFSFEDVEDRRARAHVHLLRIEMESKWERPIGKDPFDLWFDSYFTFQAEKKESSEYYQEEAEKEKLRAELVSRKDVASALVELYQSDLTNLMTNYKAIELLDPSVMRELEVNIEGLKKALKMRISGLKNRYWQMLFDNFEQITSRLTSTSRRSMLEKLTRHTNIDFTLSNIYAVVLWAIRNANQYFESQLLEMYLKLTKKENVINYVSNHHLWKDDWRYEREHTHYHLDYRIIVHNYRNFSSWDHENIRGLFSESMYFLKDIETVAENLGFRICSGAGSVIEWSPGTKKVLEHITIDNQVKTFSEVRAYKNGNIHMKFDQDFMRKLNIEAARLNGWIKSPKEASQEMEISEVKAESAFDSNFSFAPSSGVRMLGFEGAIGETETGRVDTKDGNNMVDQLILF